MTDLATDLDVFSRLGELHDTGGLLIWSVLLVDIQEARVEALVIVLEGRGLWTEAILRDPDVADRFFVQVSESRVHDAGSFSVRAHEVRTCALAHDAAVADWSARDARLSNRS